MKRDLLTLESLSPSEIRSIFSLAKRLKAAVRARRAHRRLAGRTLALVFEKPSLRTRVTFETGIAQLGGSAIYLAPGDIRLGERESVADVARNLSRWVDFIAARTFSHESIAELAEHSLVPVVNALSDWAHPCQALADYFTLSERRRDLRGFRLAYLGDGNNVAHSLVFGAVKLGIELRIACPKGYEPSPEVLAKAKGTGDVVVTHDPERAVVEADAIYTDVWTSMGQEDESEERRAAFRPYQLNEKVVSLASPGAHVMHCLPAHRGEEITDGVLDGPQSIVLDQAENRLHVQKAILVWLGNSQRRGGTTNRSSKGVSR